MKWHKSTCKLLRAEKRCTLPVQFTWSITENESFSERSIKRTLLKKRWAISWLLDLLDCDIISTRLQQAKMDVNLSYPLSELPFIAQCQLHANSGVSVLIVHKMSARWHRESVCLYCFVVVCTTVYNYYLLLRWLGLLRTTHFSPLILVIFEFLYNPLLFALFDFSIHLGKSWLFLTTTKNGWLVQWCILIFFTTQIKRLLRGGGIALDSSFSYGR